MFLDTGGVLPGKVLLGCCCEQGCKGCCWGPVGSSVALMQPRVAVRVLLGSAAGVLMGAQGRGAVRALLEGCC